VVARGERVVRVVTALMADLLRASRERGNPDRVDSIDRLRLVGERVGSTTHCRWKASSKSRSVRAKALSGRWEGQTCRGGLRIDGAEAWDEAILLVNPDRSR
jgi:hypothetical protein